MDGTYFIYPLSSSLTCYVIWYEKKNEVLSARIGKAAPTNTNASEFQQVIIMCDSF